MTISQAMVILLNLQEQPLFVRIEKFSDSSIDLLIYCFATTTNWGEWLEIKKISFRNKRNC